MQSLFRENDFTYTKDANKLNGEAHKCLSSLISKWIGMGYSPREIQSVITDALTTEITLQHAYMVLNSRE